MDAVDARRTTPSPSHNLILLELSEALAEAVTAQQVISIAARVAAAHLEPDFVGVARLDRRHGTLHFNDLPDLPPALARTWRNAPLDVQSPGTIAARDGVTVVFGNLAEAVERFPDAAEVIEASALPSRIATPLRTSAGVLGALVLGWTAEDAVSPAVHDIVVALARYVAQAMERALLFEERQAVAVVLQEAMLTRLPDVPGTGLGARYLAAAESERVGGDWYDALLRPDGTVCLMIGDVCGHDIAAAAAMGQLRAILRTMAYNRAQSPSDLLTDLDASAGPLGVPDLATAALAQIAPPDESGASVVAWSSAGHPPPIVLGPDGSTEVWDEPNDLLLGVRRDVARRTYTRTLPAGATLLLYTDGLVERRDRSVRAGIAELREVLASLAGRPMTDLLDAVVSEMVGGRPQDDVALVALRRAPAPAGPPLGR